MAKSAKRTTTMKPFTGTKRTLPSKGKTTSSNPNGEHRAGKGGKDLPVNEPKNATHAKNTGVKAHKLAGGTKGHPSRKAIKRSPSK